MRFGSPRDSVPQAFDAHLTTWLLVIVTRLVVLPIGVSCRLSRCPLAFTLGGHHLSHHSHHLLRFTFAFWAFGCHTLHHGHHSLHVSWTWRTSWRTSWSTSSLHGFTTPRRLGSTTKCYNWHDP